MNIINNKQITVFTPAYNRGYCLHLCYESLCRQSCKNFVWLVIDDGSTDNTKELVQSWINKKNDFEIKYIYKHNGGMHTAHNTAYENIETELNVCIDSDDYLTDNAIQIILDCWNKVKNEKLSGIIALDIDTKGNLIGTDLPKDRNTTKLKQFYLNGGTGDKKLIFRTDVMKKYPQYPTFEGEKYVGLVYKYDLADDEFDLYILNEPVCVVEYREDGSSANMYNQYLKCPKGFQFLRIHTLSRTNSFKGHIITCIHYVSSSIICKDKKFIKKSPKKFLTLLCLPFGLMLTWHIKLKAKKNRKFKK